MLPIGKIDDGSLKICKVEISRSRRETESVEKTSRVVGGTSIKEGFQIFRPRFENLPYRTNLSWFIVNKLYFSKMKNLTALFMALDGASEFLD